MTDEPDTSDNLPVKPLKAGHKSLAQVSEEGQLMVNAGKYSRHAVLSVFEMRGGIQGLYDWTEESAENKRDFYTKMFTRTIDKNFEIKDNRSIEDIITELDDEPIDADFEEV